MADRLTQLQDCYDQLLTQMYATIRYIDTHHAFSSIPGQADQFTPPPTANLLQSFHTGIATTDLPMRNSPPAQPGTAASAPATRRASTQPLAPSSDQPSSQPATSQDPQPDAPEIFQLRLRELAQDLVLKEQQIEALIVALPGVGNSQEAQEARLVELERELREVEEERKKWELEREGMREGVEGWIGSVRRL